MLFLLSILLIAQSKTKVFVVLHSHNDAGWLETAEDYYQNFTQYIISNVIDLLSSNPSYRFSWAETYFLSTYLEQHPSDKAKIKNFLKTGQLEIVGGGWVQNDEALPDYELVIRQMETGFQYLKQELNLTHIKTGWQLDPFGHSSLTAALMEKMGFETLVISRVELNIRNYLEITGSCEFIWKGEGFNTKRGVLTHLLNDHYYPPIFLDRQPWNQECCFKSLPATEEDVDLCVFKFEEYVNSTQYKYRTDSQLMLMGGDFFYSNMTYTLLFLDLLDRVIKKSPNLDIRYATPSEYFDEVYKAEEVFQVFSGDMFPLISSGNPYNKAWTGFFSNQPTLKKFIIDVQRLTRAAEILQTVLLNQEFISYNLATTTHHDAITGTNRPPVYTDYISLLNSNNDDLMQALAQAYHKALPKTSESTSIAQPYKVLYLFNPLDWEVNKLMSLDSPFPYIKLQTSTGKTLQVQSVPWTSGFRFYFKQQIDAFTLETLFLTESSVPCLGCSSESQASTKDFIGNSKIKVIFQEGLIKTIQHKGKSHDLNTQLMNYTTNQSGYYTFCPYLRANTTGDLTSFVIYSGDLVQVAESQFLAVNETVTQRVLLENDASEVKLLFDLKPPPNSDIFLRFNKRYTSGSWFALFNTANIMHKYFKYDSSTRKGNNYYPVNGGFFVKLRDETLYLIPSFPLSAGMVTEKAFEVNLHRYTLWDDGLGLGNITTYARPVQHEWLLGFKQPEYEFVWKKYLEHRNQPLVLFESQEQDKVTEDVQQAQVFEGQWLGKTRKQVLKGSDCAHIASLAQRTNKVLATVHNVCEKPVKYPVQVVEKTELAGLKKDLNRKNWKSGSEFGFWIYNNTGQNVMKFKYSSQHDKISSFDVVSYYTNIDQYKIDTVVVVASELKFSSWLLIPFLILAFGLVLVGANQMPNKLYKNLDHVS